MRFWEVSSGWWRSSASTCSLRCRPFKGNLQRLGQYFERTLCAAKPSQVTELPGEALDGNDPLLGFLLKFAEHRGWHSQGNMGVNVAHGARSFRTPEPRFSSAQFPLRTSFARYELPTGERRWRVLERKTRYLEEANQHGLLTLAAPVLVTFFSKGD